MKLFLSGTLFDDFQLVEGVIKTYITVNIDGHANEEFYKNDYTHTPCANEYASWPELRPLCMELIRGKNTPLYMKFILQKAPSSLAEEAGGSAPSEARSLILNLTFSEQALKLTTAINFSGFYPDSSLPELWDNHIGKLLRTAELKFEII